MPENAAMRTCLIRRKLPFPTRYVCGRTFSPRDFKGSMMAFRLSSLSAMYPNPAIAIRLLIVMLPIIAAQTGKTPKMSGGGKKSHRYPPTMTPIGRAPAAQARSLCFLSNKMRQAAMRLAMGPRITSGAPMKK